MTAFGADITRYGRSLFVWCQVWATLDNTTVSVGPPKRFLTRSKAASWGAGRVIELEHQEARREVYDQMALLSNGDRSPRPSFLP